MICLLEKTKLTFLALKYKRYWQENVTKHKIVAKTTHGKKREKRRGKTV